MSFTELASALTSGDNHKVPMFPSLPSKDDPRVRAFRAEHQSPGELPSPENKMPPASILPVAILGAGVAGIYAANALERMGITNYVVLEASDRIGGRLKDTTGVVRSVLPSKIGTENGEEMLFLKGRLPLDLGAEWIHAYDGKEAVESMLTVCGERREKLLDPSNFVAYNPTWYFRNHKVFWLKWLYQETKWNRSTWWQFFNECLVEAPSSNAGLVKDKIRLNAPVTKIVHQPVSSNSDESPTVILEIAGGTERIVASRVICTIPLAVLKTKTMRETEGSPPPPLFFDPPLPKAKVDAIGRVPMPPGYRILFEMSSKFYPDLMSSEPMWSSLTSGRLVKGDISFVYDPLLGKELSQPNDCHVLAYVAVGPHHAKESIHYTDDELAEDALRKIDELFDGKGTTHYVSHVVQNWTKDPNIMGAYTFVQDSHAMDAKAMAAPEYDECLLFAGEHTSVKFPSLVPGAAVEGVRAAVEAVTGMQSASA
eukprot:jgi/Psemu1/327590/estExt_fgenesh1_pg.C_7270007